MPMLTVYILRWTYIYFILLATMTATFGCL